MCLSVFVDVHHKLQLFFLTNISRLDTISGLRCLSGLQNRNTLDRMSTAFGININILDHKAFTQTLLHELACGGIVMYCL